jgi:eukaryotic-like serine/threonine-protein kinase
MTAPASQHRTGPQVVPPRAPSTHEERRAMARGLPLALITWPTFAALDVFAVLAVFPEVPLTRLLIYRFLGECILLWFYLFARHPRTSAELFDAAHVFAVWSAGGLISVMALEFGDLTWNYMHGLSLVMLVDATIVPTSFVRSLRMTIPVSLSFPIIMGAGAILDASLATQWTSPRSLVVFACNYIFVLATAILVSAASHGLWSARQQVYQARKLGRYRLVAPIGHGGQNEVWLAWDESLRRDVALKLLRSESKSEADVRSFEREARATSRLTSPHTIRIFDFGASSDGIFYIAMEHLSGADLATLVREHGPMPAGRVLHFARQVCLSLAEAHDAGVIHRDIKPHNLYITRVGDDHDVLKVLDFGIAKQASLEGDATMTDVGVIKGTPMYMSPEMITGGTVDARSDIYSLGITLYFLLTGVVPFDGRSWGKLVYSHLTLPPIPPSLRAREPLPQELEDLILRCLAKKPAERFKNVRELLAALEQCVANPPWTAEDVRNFWTARAAPPRRDPSQPDPGPTLRIRPDKAASAA